MTLTMVGTASTAWAYTGIVTTGGIIKFLLQIEVEDISMLQM